MADSAVVSPVGSPSWDQSPRLLRPGHTPSISPRRRPASLPLLRHTLTEGGASGRRHRKSSSQSTCKLRPAPAPHHYEALCGVVATGGCVNMACSLSVCLAAWWTWTKKKTQNKYNATWQMLRTYNTTYLDVQGEKSRSYHVKYFIFGYIENKILKALWNYWI